MRGKTDIKTIELFVLTFGYIVYFLQIYLFSEILLLLGLSQLIISSVKMQKSYLKNSVKLLLSWQPVYTTNCVQT